MRDDPGRPVGDDELLTTAEVGQMLRKPVGTLRQWRHRSFGPKGFRLGGTVVYRRSAVDAWIRECETAEAETA
jgi:predicted DNA-binding transcriptional regulator AlpA